MRVYMDIKFKVYFMHDSIRSQRRINITCELNEKKKIVFIYALRILTR